MQNNVLPAVQELHYYPIKSLRGLRTNELSFDLSGALFDRQWMLIDDKNTFVTLRQHPELVKIGVTLDRYGIELTQSEHGDADFAHDEHEGPELQVKIWKHEMPAFEVNPSLSKWFSDYLGKNVKLVTVSPAAKRLWDPENPASTLRFTDARPLLVIGRASLEQLELKAGVTIAMSRFRPNIVLHHIPPHAEDGYSSIKIGDVEFKAVKPCTRCVITTVHPLTGEKGEEPLKTLATYRRGEKGITFGYYYAPSKPGSIKLGALVTPH